LKNRASRRDPSLCGFCKCAPIAEQAALSKTPHALADGLMLVFQHPVKLSEASAAQRAQGLFCAPPPCLLGRIRIE
jgi:hypothetical protein